MAVYDEDTVVCAVVRLFVLLLLIGLPVRSHPSAEFTVFSACRLCYFFLGKVDKKRREDFGRLTDLADALLQAGQHDVYQVTKEELEEAATAAAEAEASRSSAMGEGFLAGRRGAVECCR